MLFTQIGLAIAFTTNSYATRHICITCEILIWRVKTGELHVIADFIKKINFRKWMGYISLFCDIYSTLHAVLYRKYLVLYKNN